MENYVRESQITWCKFFRRIRRRRKRFPPWLNIIPLSDDFRKARRCHQNLLLPPPFISRDSLSCSIEIIKRTLEFV